MLAAKRVVFASASRCSGSNIMLNLHALASLQVGLVQRGTTRAPCFSMTEMQHRSKSSSPEPQLDDDCVHETRFDHSRVPVETEMTSFPGDSRPVLLNSKEHAVGYLSKILNARVYEAAVETDLQYATNLSAVSSLLDLSWQSR